MTGDGRTRNSVRNILYKMSYQIISILLKFISRTVFIRVLGVEYLGINGLFTEVLQMLSLADLGFETAMVYSLYQPLAEHNEMRVAQLIHLYQKIYTIIAIVISAIGVGLIPFLKYIVNLDRAVPHIYVYYLLYLANTVSSYLVIYKTSILTADQKNYVLSKYNAIFDTAFTAVSIIVLLLSRKFMAYLVLQVFFTYMKNFYCSHKAERMYPYISQKTEPLSGRDGRAIFENMGSVFLYKLSATLVTSTDNTLISVMIGTVAVGYYSNYNMITANILVFINIIFTSLTASIGNLVIEHDAGKNYRVFRVMQQISFIFSAVAISCVYVLINDFIRVWLGESYLFNKEVVAAIVINMFFSVVLMPIWSYRDATGMYRQTKFVMLMTAAVNLVLSIILGRWIGIAGILFATSISRLTTYFWYEPKLLFRQYFHRGVGRYYMDISLNIGITVAIIIVLQLIFGRLVPDGWGMLVIKMILVLGASAGLTLLAYSRSPEFSEVLDTVKNILPNKKKHG